MAAKRIFQNARARLHELSSKFPCGRRLCTPGLHAPTNSYPVSLKCCVWALLHLRVLLMNAMWTLCLTQRS